MFNIKKTDNFDKTRLLTERKKIKKCYPKKIVCESFSNIGLF